MWQEIFFYHSARVLNKNEGNVRVEFLRKKENAFLFHYINQLEIYFMDTKDTIMKLPKPTSLGTARSKELLYFDIKQCQYISLAVIYQMYNSRV